MQSQIAALQKYDTLVFTTGQMTLTTISPTTKKVSIDNYATFSNTALTAQITAAIARITALEASLKAIQTKVTALKAVSTTTTIIQ